MARTKQNKTETKAVETKTKQNKPKQVKAEPKQNEPKQTKNVKPETLQALKELVALHPTATANVLKAFTTDPDVKQLLDEFIERGGDCPIEVY